MIKKYEDLIQIWVQKHLIYPRRAQKRRLQGIVLIRFTLSAKGKVTQAQIIEKAPYSILNKSALKTLQKAQPFPEFFTKMDKADKIFIIPIEYLSP